MLKTKIPEKNSTPMINKIKRWFQLPPMVMEEDDVYHQEGNDHTLDLNSPQKTSSFQVKDTDLEFLFHQLLQGVVNGWQEQRIEEFLQNLQNKISLDMWLKWLQRYHEQLINSCAPHGQLQSQMMILGKINTSLPLTKALSKSVQEIAQDLIRRRENPVLVQESLSSSSASAREDSLNDHNEKKVVVSSPKSELKSSVNSSLGNILSLLQKNTSLILEDKPNLENISVDPSAIMAEIDHETQSDTKPTFSEPVYTLSAEDIFNIGLEKAQKGDIEKAISLWQESVKLEPNFAAAWHNLGSAFAHLKLLTEAIESFDKALAINVNDYLSWQNRGNALFRLERWQEAIISWDRVIGIQPDFYQAWYLRGLALEKLQQYAEAIASYEKCLSIEPNFNPAHKRIQRLS